MKTFLKYKKVLDAFDSVLVNDNFFLPLFDSFLNGS